MAKRGSGFMKLSTSALPEYLCSLYDADVEVRGVWRLDGEKSGVSEDLKGFGYGFPYVIEFNVDGEAKRVVLETSWFGCGFACLVSSLIRDVRVKLLNFSRNVLQF